MSQKILLLRASGGLANRLQAVAAGAAFCLLSGRALCVDWRDGIYSDDQSNVFPQWFELRGLERADLDETLAASRGGLYPPFWRNWLNEAVAVEYLFKNNHMAPEILARTSIDFLKLDYTEQVLVGWGWNMSPALALAPLLRRKLNGFGMNDKDTLRALFRDYIVLSKDINRQVEDFAQKNFKPGLTLGLHIRHTDLQSPLEAMLKAVRDELEPQNTLFLTTDNLRVQKSVEKIFPQTVYTAKSFPPEGAPLHGRAKGLSSAQKGREALVDMYLLAHCDMIIHFRRSSFSRIPALLSGLPDDKIKTIS